MPMLERPNLSADKQALLAQRLRGVDRERSEAGTIPKRPHAGAAPLSHPQRQMWLIDQIAPGNAAYNLSVGFRMKGRLDAGALENAFNAVVARHEILRTTFAFRAGEPQQLIHPRLSIHLDETKFDHLPPDARESTAHALASEISAQPFDLSHLPLLRVSLFALDDDEHVLVVNIHHIVADGLSIALLLREVDAHYLGPQSVAARPDERLQYADFATWQQSPAAGTFRTSEIDFWRTRLGGASAILELPADRPRPAVQSFNGANVHFGVPRGITQRLTLLASREGCTPFTVLLAAFQVLLQRYAGSDDIVIGTPVAKRTRELEPLIGNFLNMVALRGDLSGDPSFAELLRRDRDVVLDAFSNSDLPFELMLKALQLERDPSRNPVFQVLLQVMAMPLPRIGDLRISHFHFDPGTAQVDLALHLYEEPDGYVGRFEYCSDLFDRQTIDRLASHFGNVLDAVVRAPELPISKIPLSSPSDQRRVLDEGNGPAMPIPVDGLVHRLFEVQKDRTPDRIALIVGATRVSYAELDARAAAIARALRERRIGRGDRVGLCLDRGVDMVAGMLGILKSGAAYVPLDPSFPADRLRFMADDAKIRLLISNVPQAEELGLPDECQWRLGADPATLETAGEQGSHIDVAPPLADDPAYVIYTSGSTGKPKGVVVPHRAVVNFLASMQREPGLRPDDVLLAVTTLSFDIAVLELQLPLTVGATVAIASRADAVDGRALAALIERHDATVMQATPVTFRMLLDAGWAGKARFKVLVGGETLPKDLADRLIALGVELWNLYGPTETTVWSTCARIADTSRGITIGRPIANTKIRIVDAHDNPTPVGVPGELCIGGAGVTLGYWNQPALTASRFVPDPWAPEAGTQLYRTGDRARFRNDGMLEHLGRIDDQVKVRGFRIELAEIENVLAEHPSVGQAAVRLWTPKPGDTRIVACCVPAKGQLPTPINLRRHARARLPEYMVPQHFLAVDAIASTPNGKIDRRRLPTPAVSESGIGRQYEPPADPAEEAIVAIWTKLIDPPQPIGRYDRFFEVGGHSLLGIQALGQIEDKVGVRLEFAALFQDSLAEIAARCRQ